ncbi:MAG: hypothetical protein J6B89_01655 [Bacilli bacterium]|nr:hypothetical protein [Bacilli bacterium]
MTYIYDILLNFTDGNRIVEFFEWDRKDIIEHIKRIPLIRVEDNTFFDLLSKEITISKEFLSMIKGKTNFFSESRSDYIILISNTQRAYALEFNNNQKIICKSSLLIDEEEEVVAFSRSLPITNIKYTCDANEYHDTFYTRKEERNRNLVLREIENAYSMNNYEKLKYMYEECFNENNNNYDEIYKKLVTSLDQPQCLRKLSFIFKLTNKKKKAINND